MDFHCYSGWGAAAGGEAVPTENRAISLAERRNKAIAPYEPARDEPGNDNRGAIRQFQFPE
jgi:hypothetical protein